MSGDSVRVACKTCLDEKSVDEFESYKYGYRKECKSCRSIYFKNRYHKSDQVRKATLESGRKSVAKNREKYTAYMKDKQCMDCGEKDPIVLDFDHVNGNKKHNVSKMVNGSYSWSSVLKEISKCEIRCANCHRRKTYKEIQRRKTNGYA